MKTSVKTIRGRAKESWGGGGAIVSPKLWVNLCTNRAVRIHAYQYRFSMVKKPRFSHVAKTKCTL